MEACPLVSLLIVVLCLHAFGLHTTTMAHRAVHFKYELVLSVKRCSVARALAETRITENVYFSWMSTACAGFNRLSCLNCPILHKETQQGHCSAF